jgi:hypothetical protein
VIKTTPIAFGASSILGAPTHGAGPQGAIQLSSDITLADQMVVLGPA